MNTPDAVHGPKTLVIMMGLPGSGKSTYVRKHLVPQGFQVVCPDAIRLAHGHHYLAHMEPLIHATAAMQARQHMLMGLPVVIDESTTKGQHFQRWKWLAEDFGYEVRLVYMDTDTDLCHERRATETPAFPQEVIDRKRDELGRNWSFILDLFPDMLVIRHDPEVPSCPLR